MGGGCKLKKKMGTSLVVQWVRLRAPNAGGPGSIPDQGTRSRMHAATKIPHAANKTWRSLNKYFLKKKKMLLTLGAKNLEEKVEFIQETSSSLLEVDLKVSKVNYQR